jgi:hypothetical protein
MSGPNTRDSKLDRLLRRQTAMDAKLECITIPLATIRVLAARVESLSRENEALMRMVGRMTIERAALRARHDRVEPAWRNTNTGAKR